jgi:hypothetical protein
VLDDSTQVLRACLAGVGGLCRDLNHERLHRLDAVDAGRLNSDYEAGKFGPNWRPTPAAVSFSSRG